MQSIKCVRTTKLKNKVLKLLLVAHNHHFNVRQADTNKIPKSKPQTNSRRVKTVSILKVLEPGVTEGYDGHNL